MGLFILGWSTGQLVKTVAAVGVGRSDNQKGVRYVNICADTISARLRGGLQKGLGTEDGASDKEVEGTQSLSWPSLANGGGGSSFVAGGS